MKTIKMLLWLAMHHPDFDLVELLPLSIWWDFASWKNGGSLQANWSIGPFIPYYCQNDYIGETESLDCVPF